MKEQGSEKNKTSKAASKPSLFRRIWNGLKSLWNNFKSLFTRKKAADKPQTELPVQTELASQSQEPKGVEKEQTQTQAQAQVQGKPTQAPELDTLQKQIDSVKERLESEKARETDLAVSQLQAEHEEDRRKTESEAEKVPTEAPAAVKASKVEADTPLVQAKPIEKVKVPAPLEHQQKKNLKTNAEILVHIASKTIDNLKKRGIVDLEAEPMKNKVDFLYKRNDNASMTELMTWLPLLEKRISDMEEKIRASVAALVVEKPAAIPQNAAELEKPSLAQERALAKAEVIDVRAYLQKEEGSIPEIKNNAIETLCTLIDSSIDSEWAVLEYLEVYRRDLQKEMDTLKLMVEKKNRIREKATQLLKQQQALIDKSPKTPNLQALIVHGASVQHRLDVKEGGYKDIYSEEEFIDFESAVNRLSDAVNNMIAQEVPLAVISPAIEMPAQTVPLTESAKAKAEEPKEQEPLVLNTAPPATIPATILVREISPEEATLKLIREGKAAGLEKNKLMACATALIKSVNEALETHKGYIALSDQGSMSREIDMLESSISSQEYESAIESIKALDQILTGAIALVKPKQETQSKAKESLKVFETLLDTGTIRYSIETSRTVELIKINLEDGTMDQFQFEQFTAALKTLDEEIEKASPKETGNKLK